VHTIAQQGGRGVGGCRNEENVVAKESDITVENGLAWKVMTDSENPMFRNRETKYPIKVTASLRSADT
jgi:hypothetical protein